MCEYSGKYQLIIEGPPLFVNQNKHDYHLKPNSPCIGAGYLSSDSSKELEESEKEINIGRYT